MTQAATDDTDTTTDVEELDTTVNTEDPAKAGDAEDAAGAGTDTEEDSVVVTIGEESPTSEEDESRAPEWVRELRKTNREKDRRIREQEQELAKLRSAGQSQTVEVGAKPTLEGCDYDEAKFEADLTAWHQRKQAVADQEREKEAKREAGQKAWQTTLDTYSKLKSELKVKDYEEVEALAQDTFNVTQQGVILSGAENPAVVIYALGKNPKKAKELASIADPVKFAFAVAKLETQLKVTPRKAAPPPEGTVRGSASIAGTVDSTLARLRADAEKTGDLSKVVAYKAQLRARERGK
jgi:hypothetical protein